MTKLFEEQTGKEYPAAIAPYEPCDGSLCRAKEPSTASSTDDQQREAQAMLLANFYIPA